MPQTSLPFGDLLKQLRKRAGMTQGWTGSFDKLEEYLAREG